MAYLIILPTGQTDTLICGSRKLAEDSLKRLLDSKNYFLYTISNEIVRVHG